MENYNEAEIRKTIEQLKPEDELFEVRIIRKGIKKVTSGYFTDAEALIKALREEIRIDCQFYVTLNRVKQECYSREQRDKFLSGVQTTSGNDIEAYQWLFIDLDPERAAGISSSKEEIEHAFDLARKIDQYMQDQGFKKPVKAVSGNGAHLLYRIELENNDSNKALIKQCLAVLANLFNTEQVKVDQSVIDPNRICKLYGTLACKGANTEDRPHRMSRLIEAVHEVEINDRETLEKLADQLPKPDQSKDRSKASNTTQKSKFDLQEFMAVHGLTGKISSGTDCTIYSLEACPFDEGHKDGDSKIFQYSNGAIAFKCHHDSCRGKHWQDVRLLYEPDAYDNDQERWEIENGWTEFRQRKREQPKESRESQEKNNLDFTLTRLSEVEELPVEWLIPGIIPKGTITSLVADGGVGKTSLWCSIVSAISSNQPHWLGGANEEFIPFEKNLCLVLSGEDDLARVLKKRLRENNANEQAVLSMDISDDRFKDLKLDGDLFRGIVELYKPALVVIDPIQSFLPAKTDMSARNHIREITDKLIALGSKYGTTFLLIIHTNKQANAWGRRRMADSSDLWDASRSVLIMGKTSNKGEVYISHEKCNYGQLQDTFLASYLQNSVLHYVGRTEKKDREFTVESQHQARTASKLEEAKEYIMSALEMAPDKMLETKELEREAISAGVSQKTFRNAKEALTFSKQIISEQKGFGDSKKGYLVLTPKQAKRESPRRENFR